MRNFRTIVRLSLWEDVWGFAINRVSRGCYSCLSSKQPAACRVLPTSSWSSVFLPGWCAHWSHGSQLWSVLPGLCVAAGLVSWEAAQPQQSSAACEQQRVTWQVARQGARAMLWPGSVPSNGFPLRAGPSVPLSSCSGVPLPSAVCRAGHGHP